MECDIRGDKLESEEGEKERPTNGLSQCCKGNVEHKGILTWGDFSARV